MSSAFDPSGDSREGRRAMSTVLPQGSNLDMLADVAVARQNRIREGANETAEIREYVATMKWRGVNRGMTGADDRLDRGQSKAMAIEL